MLRKRDVERVSCRFDSNSRMLYMLHLSQSAHSSGRSSLVMKGSSILLIAESLHRILLTVSDIFKNA